MVLQHILLELKDVKPTMLILQTWCGKGGESERAQRLEIIN